MPTRDHTLYFGQSSPTFTILGRFEMARDGSVKIAFDGWPSVENFNSGAAPIRRLNAEFRPDAAYRAANKATLDAIRDKALDLLGVGGRGWTLNNFYISTVDKVLHVSATAPEGDNTKNESMSGDKYDLTISTNGELVGLAVTFAWTYGKTHDDFLAAMTPEV
jgi:hypothetical protein